MTPALVPEVLTMLATAQAERDWRLVRRAADLLRYAAGAPQAPPLLGTARCVRDGAACAPSCTWSRALRGRCGREGA